MNQTKNIKKIDHIEDSTNIQFSDWTGIIISFKISLTPSIKGWAEPLIPTLLGPHHLCADDKTFLSKTVE